MKIPEDPFMLLSFINMKLRDEDYKDIEDLCSSIGEDCNKLINKLKAAGFEYNRQLNQFK